MHICTVSVPTTILWQYSFLLTIKIKTKLKVWANQQNFVSYIQTLFNQLTRPGKSYEYWSGIQNNWEMLYCKIIKLNHKLTVNNSSIWVQTMDLSSWATQQTKLKILTFSCNQEITFVLLSLQTKRSSSPFTSDTRVKSSLVIHWDSLLMCWLLESCKIWSKVMNYI